ncbi:MAG: hypothetical protein P4L46_19065 [Fimbriimonas sp.]|nr:hypothetical protein [Fimbriimonas sp.]
MTAADTPLTPNQEATLRRDWRIFTALTFLFGFGFQLYGGPFQNFLKDVLHANEITLGGLESMREIPGLLAALMAGTLVAFAESRIAALGLVVAGIGIAVSGRVHTFWSLVAITVGWSVGFHLWSTVQSAIILTLARGKEGGRHLGRMSAVSAVATIGGLGFAYVLSMLFKHMSYDVFFVTGGLSIVTAGYLCSRLSTHAEGGPRSRIVFRREYGLYYILTFLEGCRRQIFSIFASFALIIVYGVPVQHMLLLQLVNSVLIALTAPRIGKLVDKIGEKGPLTFYSIGLILVFLGYSTFQNVGALYALFLLDNILFSFGVGFTVYLHRIVRPGEMTPCLAMGTTMNHIAAVTVPIGGAILWKSTNNYQYPFWVGVAIACVSWFAMRFLPSGPIPAKA